MNWSGFFLGKKNHSRISPSLFRIQHGPSAACRKPLRRKGKVCALFSIFLIGLMVTPACSLSHLIPGGDPLDGLLQKDSGPITLGLVIDGNNQPVVNAVVGENQRLTDRNGVVTGVLTPNPAGLISIKAAGYVLGYGTVTQLSDGYQVMVAQLTAVDTIVPFSDGEATAAALGEPETPALQARINRIETSSGGAVLQLTEIDPWNMPEPWLTSTSGDLNLLYSFAVSAVDRWGEPLPVETPGEIMIASQDQEHLNLVLAYFDPDQGEWVEIPDGCSRKDPQYLRCNLPHFSSFGIFGPGSAGGALGTGASDPGGASSSDSDLEAYFEALARLGEIYKNADKTGQMPDEETLRKAIEDLQKAAENLADKSSPEVGKNVLAEAAARAYSAGQTAAGDAMMNGARDIIRDIAEDLLNDDDCGKLSELTHTASQAMGVGGMPDIANQLMDKLKDRQKKCNVWKGTIHYTFFLDGSWPGNSQWEYYSGAQSWVEIHEVTIAINPDTGALDGDSIVTLKLPGAEYRHTKETDCGPIHNHQHVDTGGGSGTAVLSFDGFYQEGTFTISPMEIKSSSPVSTQHHAYYALTYAPAPPPQCIPTEKEIHRIQIAEYTSQLIHGFFGAPEPPSLQDMLNTGSRSQVMDTEVIRGTQDLSYAAGSNQSPLIPISRGTVTWNFIRVNKAGK